LEQTCFVTLVLDLTVTIFFFVSRRSVFFGSLLGLQMLGETLMAQGWSGVAILMTGIALVATDPGEKVQGH
jgi:uncharacterized membrane protein